MDVYDKSKTRPIWDRVLAGREATPPQDGTSAPACLPDRALQLQAAYTALAAGPCRRQQRALQTLAQQCRERARQLAAAEYLRSGRPPQPVRSARPDLRNPAALLRQLYYLEREDAAAMAQLGRQQPEQAAIYDTLARQAAAHMRVVGNILQAHMGL